MSTVLENVKGVFVALSEYFTSVAATADKIPNAAKQGIEMSVVNYPYSCFDGDPKSIVIENTELEHHRACVFKLDTLREHSFLKGVYVMDAPLSMGLNGLTGAEKFKLYMPLLDDGNIDLEGAFVEYYGAALPRKLQHGLSAVMDDLCDLKEVRQVSFKTFLAEGFFTGYNQAFDEFQLVYGDATFDVSAKKGEAFHASLDDGVEQFNFVVQSYIEQAGLAIKQSVAAHREGELVPNS
ncbi:MAG: hypothetical protein ACRBCT_09900 [Alphaproteobacteria bacterium]